MLSHLLPQRRSNINQSIEAFSYRGSVCRYESPETSILDLIFAFPEAIGYPIRAEASLPIRLRLSVPLSEPQKQGWRFTNSSLARHLALQTRSRCPKNIMPPFRFDAWLRKDLHPAFPTKPSSRSLETFWLEETLIFASSYLDRHLICKVSALTFHSGVVLQARTGFSKPRSRRGRVCFVFVSKVRRRREKRETSCLSFLVLT